MNELFESNVVNWLLVMVSAFIIGLSKAGIKGIDILNIIIMTIVFGGKVSTGVVLPLLCIADVFAVRYYHRHADWHQFWKLLPWMAVGILIGVIVGKDLNEAVFRKIMAGTIILTVVIMLVIEYRKTLLIPHSRLFAAIMGLTSGFTTMLGNLAGAFSSLYFLALRIPKDGFIGTAAWLFLVINYFKLPFQVLVWKNVTTTSLKVDAMLVPFMLIGFFAGVKLVAKLKDESYRKVVILLTLAGAVLMVFKH